MSNLMNTVEPIDINIVGAEDVFLITDKQKVLYDLFNDVGVVGLGHSALRSVFKMLAEGEPYSIPAVLGSEWREKAAEWLCNVMDYEKVFFCNSGTEAIEAAIKLVRRYASEIRKDKRNIIYTLRGAFHGRTYGALSASDSALHHKEGFGPFLPGFKYFTEIDEINWDECLAVMITPAFVNNDVVLFSEGYLRGLYDAAESAASLFIVDEIQTGFGRCGEWKLIDAYGIYPDIITVGKGIANGLPVGAVLSSKEIAKVFTPGRHFSTYGGAPIGMMAVCKVIELVEPMIQSRAIYETGEYFINELSKLKWIKHVRGIGLLLAVDLDMDARKFCKEARKHGVMIATFYPECFKITPPLILTTEDIDNIINTFEHIYVEHGDEL